MQLSYVNRASSETRYPTNLIQPDVQRSEAPNSSKVRYESNPDGDIVDLDWDRVRRFVQRVQWHKPPPDNLRYIESFRENSAPIQPTYSRDGDSVDFNSYRGHGKNGIYNKDGKTQVGLVESKGECTTCENRRYVDQSDDSSVSYQTPTKLNPQTATMAVAAHEREHVFNERAKAHREGREIVNQTVSVKYAICPECNTMYPCGGTTRTHSVKKSEDNNSVENNPSEGSNASENGE